jgi:hypothetical protein
MARAAIPTAATSTPKMELAHNAHVLFESQPPTEKRKLLDFVLSNCTWKSGELTAKYRQPFDVLAVAVASEQQRVGGGMTETARNDLPPRRGFELRRTLPPVFRLARRTPRSELSVFGPCQEAFFKVHSMF